MRKQFSKYNIGFYNIYIAVNNNIVIILAFLIFYSQSKDDDVQLWSNVACKSINFIFRSLVMYNSWLNVLITVDRLLCIKYPNKYKHIEKRKFIYPILFFLLLGNMICNSPSLLLYVVSIQTYNQITNQTLITKKCTSAELAINIRDTLVIIFRILLPFLLMFIFNITIIKNLRRMKNNLNITRELNREYNFSFSIIALNMLFIISLLPNVVTLILLNVVQYGYKAQISSKSYAIINFCFSISILIATYSHVFPFLVNLKFNKLFRKEFYLFIRIKKISQIHSNNLI
jgi:hypothetical protein